VNSPYISATRHFTRTLHKTNKTGLKKQVPVKNGRNPFYHRNKNNTQKNSSTDKHTHRHSLIKIEERLESWIVCVDCRLSPAQKQFSAVLSCANSRACPLDSSMSLDDRSATTGLANSRNR